ncbi:hypothetical protein M0804_015216 [Polistes exclamans]|nr:hypothetical protein M0804_015217 [Polistes exclamans]KAI4473710.1 hypothetical protein M0804_015216 [Polistes exclamans]
MIVDYNLCKSIVDLFDQMIAYSSPLRKTIKFDRKLTIELLLLITCVDEVSDMYLRKYSDDEDCILSSLVIKYNRKNVVAFNAYFPCKYKIIFACSMCHYFLPHTHKPLYKNNSII